MHAKTILTVLAGDQQPEDLDPAIEFCRENEAHLSVYLIGVSPPPPTLTYGGLPADVWVQAVDEARDEIAQRSEAVEAHLKSSDITCDVAYELTPSSLIDDEVGRRARYTDMTLLVSSDAEDVALKHHIIGGALFESDRPLLLLNKDQAAFKNPKTVVIAWDASREASKAVNASIGLLKTADDVRLVLVDPEPVKSGHGPEPGSDMATYLARHGVKVTVDRIAGAGRGVYNTLIQHAGDHSADLIIMGGYGHSRLRERVFGGMTESMLQQTGFPVLMMH